MLLVLDACDNYYDTKSTSSACNENVTQTRAMEVETLGPWRSQKVVMSADNSIVDD